MSLFTKHWLNIASFGQGMLLALALVGAVRIAALLHGTPISGDFSNQLFLIGSFILGPITLYFRTAERMVAGAPRKAG